MSLKIDKVREIVFGEYDNLIKYANSSFNYLKRQGMSTDEFVNEAIIHIFDRKEGFKSAQEVIKFVKDTIISVSWREYELLKDKHFYTKIKDDDEYSLIDKGVEPCSFSSEFIKIFNTFEKYRFGQKGENKKCNSCGCRILIEMDTLVGIRWKCMFCRKAMSITSKTYISASNLKYSTIYSLVTHVSKNEKITSVELARRCGITQTTAYYRKKLIKSIVSNIGNATRSKIIYKLLTVTHNDIKPVKIIEPKLKFNPEDITNMKRLFFDKINTPAEISRIYNTDSSTIRKILTGKLYSGERVIKLWKKSGQLLEMNNYEDSNKIQQRLHG